MIKNTFCCGLMNVLLVVQNAKIQKEEKAEQGDAKTKMDNCHDKLLFYHW